jgi:hypothetical protein
VNTGHAADVGAVVTVALDPDDDYAITHAALSAHDLESGQITVHPTPGTRSLSNLGRDVLIALGKNPDLVADPSSITEVWCRATAWTCAYQISKIVVLRTHLLSQGGLARLAQLAADTGAALTLVWHDKTAPNWREILPTATLTVLGGIQQEHEAARTGRITPSRPVPQPVYCTPSIADPAAVNAVLAEPLPPLPDSALPTFRADLYRTLRRRDFARADTLYAAGMDSACAFLSGHPGYTPVPEYAAQFPQDWEDLPALWNYLVSVPAGSPSAEHTRVLLRGAQAGFLRHGLLLQIPQGSGHCTGPGFSEVPFTPQTAQLIRDNICDPLSAAALALLLITGLPASDLGPVPAGDLSPTASRIRILHGQLGEVIFPIPPFGRDLLKAAHYFTRPIDPEPSARLFTESNIIEYWQLLDAVNICGLDMPLLREAWAIRETPWHLQARCSWIGTAIHDNRHHHPDQEAGFHVPQA